MDPEELNQNPQEDLAEHMRGASLESQDSTNELLENVVEATDDTNRLMENSLEVQSEILEEIKKTPEQQNVSIQFPDDVKIIQLKGDKGDKGDTGDDGYTPQAGIDFYTDEEIDEIKSQILEKATPKLGEDYFTNMQLEEMAEKVLSRVVIPKPIKGEAGKTPVKGVDYFTPNEVNSIVKDVLSLIPKPKAAKTLTQLTKKQILEMVKGNIDYEDIKNTPTIFKGQMAGTGYLREITDVQFTNLTDGQALVWDATLNKWKNGTVASGGGTWGTITGTLSAQTDLQAALDAKANTSHSHAISDVTGLQTALDGKASSLGADDNYVTDAEKVKLSNLSGTNTGDQDLSGLMVKANNLSDLTNAATARTNLGVAIGTNVQAFNQNLADIAGLADPNADRLLFWDDSSGAYTHLTLGTNLSITGTTINAAGGAGGLSDGDYGDITVSGTGTVLTIDTGTVTYAKMQDVSAENKILGRITAGAGDVEELTAANVKTILGLTTADVPDSLNKRYVTDAQLTVIGNTSGTNTGDQDLSGYVKTDQTVGQTIGLTGARLTKLWATDITVTNAIVGSVTGNAATVTTNANLTGHITSVGNAAVLGSFTVAQLNTAISDADVATGGGTATGTNTGDQTSVTGNAGTATALQTPRTIGGVSFDGTANITVATATGGFTVSGGNLALGTNSITMSGSIGVTGTRVTKGWFTDLEVTNAIVGSITGNAATVTTNANLTGDVTSSGNATTIGAGKVTLAMQANMATASVVYRKTAGSGAPEVQTLATLKTDLGLTGTNSGDQTITLTGDVTGTGTGSFAAIIANDAVTLAKMANMATDRLLGRDTAGTGDPEVLTVGGGIEFTGSGGIQTSAFTGDVTKTAGGTALSIAAGVVTEAMQVLADNTTNNVSTSKHGYAPKGDGSTTKFLNANGAYSTPASASTKEFFVPFMVDSSLTPIETKGDFLVLDSDNGATTNIMPFFVPNDFTSLTSLVVVGIANGTETVQWDCTISFASAGEVYTTNTASDLNRTLAVTINKIVEYNINQGNIATLTASLSAGDYVGITFLSNTANMKIMGVRFKYS